MKLIKLRHTGYRIVGSLAAALGYRTRSPVFIIGTGRCGTTLLVKILNSHPQLVGFPDEANEFGTLKRILLPRNPLIPLRL